MRRRAKGTALGDISGLGVMSVTLTGAFVFTLLTILLGATEAFLPVAMELWRPALYLFAVAVGTEVLRFSGVLREWPVTMVHSVVSMAVPVVLAFGVAAHGDFLETKRSEAICVADRERDIDEATRRHQNLRAALKRCQTDFEDNKTIFTPITVEVACRSEKRSADNAAAEMKRAAEQPCGSMTGALPARR
jgi:hypothetical protein